MNTVSEIAPHFISGCVDSIASRVWIAFRRGSGRLNTIVIQAMKAVRLRSVNQDVSGLAYNFGVTVITRVADPDFVCAFRAALGRNRLVS